MQNVGLQQTAVQRRWERERSKQATPTTPVMHHLREWRERESRRARQNHWKICLLHYTPAINTPFHPEALTVCVHLCVECGFKSGWRSLSDRSMCLSSIDGKALQLPLIKTNSRSVIKVVPSGTCSPGFCRTLGNDSGLLITHNQGELNRVPSIGRKPSF